MIYAMVCCAGNGDTSESQQLAMYEIWGGFQIVRPANTKVMKGNLLKGSRNRTKQDKDWTWGWKERQEGQYEPVSIWGFIFTWSFFPPLP